MSGPEDAPARSPDGDATLGQLVHDLTTQVPELIRSEIRLAQAEMAEKGKRAGIGIGLFSGAGLLACYGVAILLAAAVLGLAALMPPPLAALVVGTVVLAAAGFTAYLGKGQVEQATPPAPERAVEGIKEDIKTVKGHQ